MGFNQYETNNEVGADGVYGTNPAVFARKAAPYDSPYYYTVDDNGNIQWGDRAQYLHFTQMSTVDFVNDTRNVQRKQVTANINLYEELTPIKGLTIRAQQAVDAYDYNLDNIGYQYDAFDTPMGDHVNGRDGYRQNSFQRYYSFTYTNTAEYKFNIDEHNVTVLAGQESIISKNNVFGVSVQGHTDNRQLLLTQGTSVSVSNLTHSISESVFNSYFFTGSYNYAEKYYLDLSFRRDGSSKFAPDNRWASFWSVGAMWNMKKENFLADVDWLNELEINASYGTTGNSSIDDYMYFGLIGSGSNTYNGQGTLGISQASNYDLTWETVASTNVGLSFRLFDRVSADVEFYNKKTTDMLMSYPMATSLGFDGYNRNIGSMRNQGWDITLSGDIFNEEDFGWRLTLMGSTVKNKVLHLADKPEIISGSYITKEGETLNSFYTATAAGVDPATGAQLYWAWDTDENGVAGERYITDDQAKATASRSIQGSRIPNLYGSFTNEFRYKDFDLSVLFTYSIGGKVLDGVYRTLLYGNYIGQAKSAHLERAWMQPGDITDIPRIEIGKSYVVTDNDLINASYLSLKNITFGYTLPKKLTKQWKMESVRLTATGDNLVLFNHLKGMDPQYNFTGSVSYTYTPSRAVVLGLDLNF